jgi:hypothetical protein
MSLNLARIVKTAIGAVPSSLRGRITFTQTTRSIVSATNVAGVPTVTTVAGDFVQDNPSPQFFANLNLKPERSVKGFFVPDTEGEVPPVGASCAWGGMNYDVKVSDPIAPAGANAAGADVVLSR